RMRVPRVSDQNLQRATSRIAFLAERHANSSRDSFIYSEGIFAPKYEELKSMSSENWGYLDVLARPPLISVKSTEYIGQGIVLSMGGILSSPDVGISGLECELKGILYRAHMFTLGLLDKFPGAGWADIRK